MAQHLVAIANLTGSDAKLASSDQAGDGCAVPTGQITHTGGRGDDYVEIPKCSGSEWFDSHHISVWVGDLWAVSLWIDDQSGYPLQWNPDGVYDGFQTVPNSTSWDGVCAMIELDDAGRPTLSAAAWL